MNQLLFTVAALLLSCSAPETIGEIPIDPQVDITANANETTSITVGLSPNRTTANYVYAIGSASDQAAFEAGTIAGYTSVTSKENKTVTFDDLAPSTEYTVFTLATSDKGVKGKVNKLAIRTKAIPDASALRCVGYLTTWDYNSVFNNLDWEALTHINVGWCNPNGAGDLSMGWDDATFKSVVDKAHANGVKVLPSVRDGDPALFSTAQSRTSFVTKILAYLEKYDLDGLDIDLEKSEPNFWTNYEAFIVELRGEFDKKGLLLTTAVSTWFSDNITDRTFACFDFVNIMAYDLGRPNHSTFEGMKRMAEHYRDRRGIPADRIVCGVPFYGYNKATPENNFSDYKRYFEIIAADTSAADKDESAVDGNIYAYNGRPTMKRKCEFARDFGGIMIWSLPYDTTDSYSLLKVIKENLFAAGAAPRPVQN